MKNYVRLQGNQGSKGQVTPDIDGFTDEPVAQCDVQVVENIFTDDSK